MTCFLQVVFYNLRATPTQYRSTAMRETTSLEGERAQQAAYSLPFQRFSLALSFPHSPLSYVERTNEVLSHDFMSKTLFCPVLRSIVRMQNSCTVPQGGWGRRKVGDWGCLPKIVANPYNKKQGLRPVQIILRQFSPGAALRGSDFFRT